MGERFIANLTRQVPLAPDDRQAAMSLLGAPYFVRAEAEIVEEGDLSADCHVLLDGQAFRHKTLPDGRRQILGFAVTGDVLDLSRLSGAMDYGVVALTPCKVAPLSMVRLDEELAGHPAFARAFRRLLLAEGAIQREWMIGMGRRSAHARVAHLLCEVYLRLRAAGVTTGPRCRFPVTQNHLADAVGLSAVHMNRVLQALRSDRLIDFRARELVIHDWAGLAELGEFEAGYLRLPSALIAEVGQSGTRARPAPPPRA